ncbi:MoaD/ThiS family protein [Halegenticoccus soli]|uniref:MoaD/ThiS family protein n=1 Tax=Halegenticoccus soli TaxID=1985678 RepID=UPI000C6C9A85|nr:MoaD/ThiS family protein [Halegenticoccus soli]
MEIEIRCYGEVRDAVGASSLAREFDEATVADALDALDSEFPAFDADALTGGLVVMRNGRHVADPDAAALSDGDALSLSESPMRE